MSNTTGLLDCTLETCALETSLYGYRPNLAASGVYISLAATALIATVAITIKTRQGIAPCLLTSTACVLVILGYSDRISGWSNPWELHSFIQGTAVVTIAPLFITSSLYTVVSRIITKLGREHSLVNPSLYTYILIPHDLVALILQIAGYAIAFPPAMTERRFVRVNNAGINAVLAGIVIQLATLVATLLFYVSVVLRAVKAQHRYGYTTFHKDVGYVPLTTPFLLAASLFPVSCLCLLGRCVYRITTLVGGPGGSLARDQGLFLGVEGFLVTLALLFGIACHPGVFTWDRNRDTADESLPFVASNLEEVSKVYKEQDRVLARNASTRVMMV